MKRIIAIYLLLILCFSLFFKIEVILYWKLNQDYIAKNLCINIDKPEMACKGKCQLNKQLLKADASNENNKQTGQHKLKIPSYELYCHSISQRLTIGEPSLDCAHHFAQPPSQYHFDYFFRSFKPPVMIG